MDNNIVLNIFATGHLMPITEWLRQEFLCLSLVKTMGLPLGQSVSEESSGVMCGKAGYLIQIRVLFEKGTMTLVRQATTSI